MRIVQQRLQLKERRRGFHLITNEVLQALPQLREINVGMCQVFIQHTSASLTINENGPQGSLFLVHAAADAPASAASR